MCSPRSFPPQLESLSKIKNKTKNKKLPLLTHSLADCCSRCHARFPITLPQFVSQTCQSCLPLTYLPASSLPWEPTQLSVSDCKLCLDHFLFSVCLFCFRGYLLLCCNIMAVWPSWRFQSIMTLTSPRRLNPFQTNRVFIWPLNWTAKRLTCLPLDLYNLLLKTCGLVYSNWGPLTHAFRWLYLGWLFPSISTRTRVCQLRQCPAAVLTSQGSGSQLTVM